MPSRSRAKRSLSGPVIAALILLGVGALIALGGVLVVAVFPRLIASERARVEDLTPLGPAALADTPAGRAVLVEGKVSSDQPALFRDFVAYSREERETSDTKFNPWRGRETRLPPLTLLAPDGPVRITNADYVLTGEVRQWAEPNQFGRIETRYVGLVRGEAVLVLGKAAAGGLQAEWVTPGTRATYLKQQAEGNTVAVWLGGGLAAAGAITMLIGAIVAVAGRKRSG